MFGTRTRTVVDDSGTTTGGLWSPAQLVALAIGLAAIVFGALALSRTGLDLDHLTEPHDSFAGFHHTPLAALSEIAFGVGLMISAMQPVFGRTLMALLGFATLGLGIVVVADFWPRRMHEWLAAHDRNGWMYIIAGGVVLLAAFTMPMVSTGGSRQIVEEHVHEDEYIG